MIERHAKGNQIQSPLSHKQPVVEVREQYTCLISNNWIETTFYVSGSSRDIPTIVGITRKGRGCKRRICVRFIVINLLLCAKLFCGRVVRIGSEVRGEVVINVIRWFLV